MGSLVSGFIQHFSYLGLLVVLILCGLGLPVPEDVALLAGGFMVHRGLTQYPETLIVSLAGVVIGDNSLYFIGQRFGAGLLHYFGVDRPHSRRRIERLREFMHRHGNKTIFYARFFAGFRAVVYLSAGSLGVGHRQFFFYDFLGAVISVPVVVSLGYFFGEQIDVAIRYVGGVERTLVIIAGLSAAILVMRILLVGRKGEKQSSPC